MMKDRLSRGFHHAALAAFTAAFTAIALPDPVFAHAADRGFILLLPTRYYFWGGALAVALSFAALALVPPAPVLRALTATRRLATVSFDGRLVTSWLSFSLLLFLLYAGLHGSRDPLSNPLPLIVWTIWWIGLTLAIALFGNLWRWLEPWYGPARLIARIAGRDADAPLLVLPQGVGYGLAIAGFAGFAWFELVHPAPVDPERLAIWVGAYWLGTLAAILIFGHRDWMRRGECFAVFFRLIAQMAPFQRRPFERGGEEFVICPPGGRLMRAQALPLSGVLFLLLALSTVSFDGFMRTFTWLGWIGINPLEFPGRSAVMVENTLGLALMFAALSSAFFLAVWLGARLVRGGTEVALAAGHLIWSIVPIALAYHFSHYLVALMIDAQYALAAISDPLSTGANLFGTAGYHVMAGATLGMDNAWLIWNLQAGAIIGGHVLAVLIAHVLAYRLHGDNRRAALSQIPLAVLMIFYTVFGLWLLASPTA